MSVYPLEAVQAEDSIGVNRALVLSLRHHSGALTLPDYLTYDCKQYCIKCSSTGCFFSLDSVRGL